MADVKISALVANTTPNASDVVAVSKSDNSATNKVTLGNVAALAVSSAGAVPSDTTGISGASTITNIVRLSQSSYDAISSPSASTLYIIEG
jgi:hypothetical protein